jgi:hypothetical protein
VALTVVYIVLLDAGQTGTTDDWTAELLLVVDDVEVVVTLVIELALGEGDGDELLELDELVRLIELLELPESVDEMLEDWLPVDIMLDEVLLIVEEVLDMEILMLLLLLLLDDGLGVLRLEL